jgi:hypothetical protein
MAGEVLRFPAPEKDRRCPPLRLLPEFETFGSDKTQELLAIAQQNAEDAKTLLQFIHSYRDLAHNSGVETIGIEIIAVIEGERFARALDELEDAVKHSRPSKLTHESLELFRRVELLLAESSANIRRFTESDFLISGTPAVARSHSETIMALKSAIGASRSSSRPLGQPSGASLWLPLAIFGAIAVTITVIAVVAVKKHSR